MRTYGLDLVRSDTGDGGWSLHAPEMEDKDGLSPVLASGPADMFCGEWDRPNQQDYDLAQAVKLGHVSTAEGLEAEWRSGDEMTIAEVWPCAEDCERRQVVPVYREDGTLIAFVVAPQGDGQREDELAAIVAAGGTRKARD